MGICEWCGDEFAQTNQRGPDAKFCKPSHRQRAYESRRNHKFDALIPEVIEQLEAVRVDYGYSNYEGRRAIDAIIVKLREASQ